MSTVITLLLLHFLTTDAVRIVNYPMRAVDGYRSYSDVTLLHFKMPEQIHFATWNFTAQELKQSFGFSSCEPLNMTAYLKHGGLPVVNPDDSTFPDFYYVREDIPDKVEFQSNKESYFLNITNPMSGDWFAIVFNDYTDPDDDGIVQSGLTVKCATVLEASIDVTYVDEMIVVAPNQPIKSTLNQFTPTRKFNFYVPVNTKSVCVSLSYTNTSSRMTDNNVVASLESTARSFGSVTLDMFRSEDEECEFEFIPTVNSWHYLTVILNTLDKVSFDYEVFITFKRHDTYNDCNVSLSIREFHNCWETVSLIRESYGGFFAYGFVRTPLDNGTTQSYIELSTLKPTLLSFIVNSVQDIGGVLSIEIKIHMPSLSSLTNKYLVKVVACLEHEALLTPQSHNACLSDKGVTHQSQLQVNTTSETSKTYVNLLHVPFPEYGTWYLTLMPFCFHKNATDSTVETPCDGLDRVNTSFLLESASCDPNSCGDNGKCYSYMNGGIMFSACKCWNGYRGWGCTDDSKVTPNYELLVAVLLLTLSNLFFIPAIIVSIQRRYFTEALVYAFTMFFSTFYHACDAGGGIYSFCLVPGSVLSFCDFYSAVLAIWVTIIAMANLSPKLTSLAHMAGAISIALGSEYDRTSLWMFLTPVLFGFAILILTWGIRMKRTRSCYPNVSYWKYYLPPGLVLILVGLICFAFLETTKNYKYVHSSWHAIIAISVLIVLPKNDFKQFKVEVESGIQDNVGIP